MNNIIFVLLRRLHSPLIVLICVYAVSILGFVLIPGMDDQGRPWRMDFFHAFYFVSYMGTTIGFGEIPYPFTDAQRMWAVVSIYATVVAWLYGIGAMFSALQNKAFQELLTINTFRRRIRRLHGPFYLICGYGDTGSMLVKALTEAGMQAVVVEINEERINALELEDLNTYVPGLRADASKPEMLRLAGLELEQCIGVVALTNHDRVNLQIAITSKLLNPGQLTIARAETDDAYQNIQSFGTEQIINPFKTFAGRLAMALHAPGMYLLYEWLTSVPHETLTEPLYPKRGKWVLCGFGRFGKSVYERLQEEWSDVRVIEAEPEITGAPEDVVVGRGTEARTLMEAGIQDAVGIVAGTNDDGNNLSILMTARQLNRDLFMVARQNSRSNDAIFEATHVDLIMRRGSIIAHKIFALIQSPLLDVFLNLAKEHENDWANEVVSRLSGVLQEEPPVTWELDITAQDAPALHRAVTAGERLSVRDLYRDPRYRDESLSCFPLLLRRGVEDILLPDDAVELKKGDRLLFAGQASARYMMEWIRGNQNVLSYILTGEEHPSGYLWRLFYARRKEPGGSG
ncbi:MAG: NAD-binding protein [Proteobacteria bacterium]|jgi:voltage-gated potassium channel|nr:NAD-binding protein [Pseudomonadota bacterium]